MTKAPILKRHTKLSDKKNICKGIKSIIVKKRQLISTFIREVKKSKISLSLSQSVPESDSKSPVVDNTSKEIVFSSIPLS